MDDVVLVASEFIHVYYTSFVYRPLDLPKFYDPDKSRIWRQPLGSKIGIPFSGALAHLIPSIEEGSSVTISNFNVIPVDRGFALTVTGTIVHKTASRIFSQFFTIKSVGDRFFVLSDSLTLLDGKGQLPPSDEETVVIPRVVASPEPARPPSSRQKGKGGRAKQAKHPPGGPPESARPPSGRQKGKGGNPAGDPYHFTPPTPNSN
jgi:hypothetical protein